MPCQFRVSTRRIEWLHMIQSQVSTDVDECPFKIRTVRTEVKKTLLDVCWLQRCEPLADYMAFQWLSFSHSILIHQFFRQFFHPIFSCKIFYRIFAKFSTEFSVELSVQISAKLSIQNFKTKFRSKFFRGFGRIWTARGEWATRGPWEAADT